MVSKFLICLLAQASLFAAPGYFLPWGKDSDLIYKPETLSTPSQPENPLSKSADQMLLFYQNIISPTSSARSNFRPTSSRYMLLAIRRHGLGKGLLMGCDRLLRENKDPWVYRTITINKKTYKFDPTIEIE